MGLQLTPVSIAEPYRAYLVPVRAFPLGERDQSTVAAFIDDFCSTAARVFGCGSEVFVQLEQFHGKEPRELFADHGKKWLPETGLGIWVDRPKPEKWTKEELEDLIPGDRLRPLMFQVFRISTGALERVEARSKLFKYGSILEIFTVFGDDYLPKVKPIFMAGIVDRTYRCFPYYVPLIECKNLAKASREQLDDWFDSTELYVRQSFEDQGVILAAPRALDNIFTQMGGRLEGDFWKFPDRDPYE